MEKYIYINETKYTREEFEPIANAMTKELAALIDGLKAAEAVALAFDGKLYNKRIYAALDAAQEQKTLTNGNASPRFHFYRPEYFGESERPCLSVVYENRCTSTPRGFCYFDGYMPRTFYPMAPYIDESGRVIGAGLVAFLQSAGETVRRELFKFRDALENFDLYASKAAAAAEELGRIYGEINPLFRARIRPYYYYDLRKNPYQEREDEGIKTI